MSLDKIMAFGSSRVAGVDEVGRGPLIGPVVAAAVVLPEHYDLSGLNDSKRLSRTKRVELDRAIREQAIAFSIAEVSAAEIDEINILNASLLAMKKAIDGLCRAPRGVLVDGNKSPQVSMPVATVVGGDAKVPSISAASIIAKVYRDALLEKLDRRFPGYGLAQNAGYPTKAHRDALNKLGPTSEHRKSFKPVALAMRNVV